MKRILVLALAINIALSGCSSVAAVTNEVKSDVVEENDELKISYTDKEEATVSNDNISEENTQEVIEQEIVQGDEEKEVSFSSIREKKYQEYLNQELASELTLDLDNEKYVIAEIKNIYISQEYIDEVEYNSKSNVYFGYTLEELDEQFQGTRYVFTLGDDGKTTIIPYKEYDDTWDKCLENVSEGTGALIQSVVIIATTPGDPYQKKIVVTVLIGGAVTVGTVAAVVEGVTTAIETGDTEEALKHAATSGSEGYKMAAIVGYEVVDYFSENGFEFSEE